jgi:hypothetical protein
MSGERSTAEILRAARERIADPERWCQGYYARDPNGAEVEPDDVQACKWCAVGSLCLEVPWRDEAHLYLVTAAIEVGTTTTAINDGRDHSAVMALFNRAIELAEASS